MMALALLGVAGQKVTRLPTTAAVAIQLVESAARAQHVPAGNARAAYKRAPYERPVMKYLYAIGWIGGKKEPLSCTFTRASQGNAEQETTATLKRNKKLIAQLGKLHVSPALAAKALVRGVVSACSL
jgi:hypothetical protein